MVYSCVKKENDTILIKEESQNYGKKNRKNHIQMNKILKRLFTLKNSKPIIDFLNSAYKDNISYEAKLYYADREINNFEKKSSRYISFYADMYIRVIDKENIYEYEIEFQTVYEDSMAIRMFRYGFERAVKIADYSSIKEGRIKIKLPEPYLIVLEEDKNITENIFLEIEIPKQDIIKYTCKVLKYFNYDIDRLVIENMYLLLPLQIFKLRKRMYKINISNLSFEEKKDKMIHVIKELFPMCERVSAYATPKDILKKSLEELKELKALGIGILYMGIESGSDIILKQIQKGVTSSEIIEAGRKVKDSGIKLSVTFISGIGGKDKWKDHAIEYAKVISAINPDYVGLLTLMVEPKTQMYEEVNCGKFKLLDREEIMVETKELLENIDVTNCIFRSNHASNYVNIGGSLPLDKEKMLSLMDDILKGNYFDFK